MMSATIVFKTTLLQGFHVTNSGLIIGHHQVEFDQFCLEDIKLDEDRVKMIAKVNKFFLQD